MKWDGGLRGQRRHGVACRYELQDPDTAESAHVNPYVSGIVAGHCNCIGWVSEVIFLEIKDLRKEFMEPVR